MSSSSPPPPPRSQRPLHNFELPSDLKWSTKSQNNNNPTRGRRLPKPSSSSSARQRPILGKGQSTLQRSSPLRFKIKSPGSSTQVPSSFHPWRAAESGSSSQGTLTLPGLNVIDKESNSIDCLLGSSYAVGSFDKEKIVENNQVDSGLKKMSEHFEKNLLVSDMNEEEMNNDDKPLKKYVRSNKKKLQQVKENKPVVALEDDSVDMDAKLWSFRPTKPDKISQSLNLEKNVGSSFKDHGESIEENIDKQFKALGKSKQESAAKKKKEKKKKKNKEKEPKQEQQIEIKLPKFSVQLTPQEIADDLFAMTGTRPTRKPKRRTKIIQKQVDQVTPGLWLESIDAEDYIVNENVGKGK